MIIKQRELTIEEGIKIQDEHLSEWKCILKDEAYQMLEPLVKQYNELAKTGWDICRGHRIHQVLLNNVIRKF